MKQLISFVIFQLRSPHRNLVLENWGAGRASFSIRKVLPLFSPHLAQKFNNNIRQLLLLYSFCSVRDSAYHPESKLFVAILNIFAEWFLRSSNIKLHRSFTLNPSYLPRPIKFQARSRSTTQRQLLFPALLDVEGTPEQVGKLFDDKKSRENCIETSNDTTEIETSLKQVH